MSWKTIRSILRGDPDKVATIIWLLPLGVVILAIAGLFDFPGVITGVFAAGYGASAASLSDWRRERGLTMLSAVYFAVYSVVYLCFIYGQIRDALRGIQPQSIALILDFSIATLLLASNLRFLWQVAKRNRALSAVKY